LETVASIEVGTGKDIDSDEGKVGEIQRRFEEDKLSLAKYNILDCILVTQIFDKLSVVEKLMRRATTLKVPMDKLNIVNSIMDRVVVPMLHREGFIPPNQTSLTSSSKKPNRTFRKGEPGLYRNLFLLELDDIIPNIIQFFSIDFYSKLHNLTDRIETPNNQYFSSTKSIIPRIMKRIIDSETIPEDSKQFAIKQILAGLNNQANRFYDPKIMETIEYTEQWLCETIGRWIENNGGKIIFIDEGEMMISLAEGMDSSHLEGIIKKVMRELASQILRDYGVNSKFTLSIKDHYQQIFIPKGGFKSGVSSYVGYNEEEDLQYIGVELPQSEYCNFAKDFSNKLLLAIFKEDEVESIVSETIDRLDEGEYGVEDLLLKNRLPKSIDRERENLPNHLKAAIMLNDDQLRFKKEIEYLVCEEDIYPKEVEHGEIDLNFYKDKQIKPLVDNILFVKDMKYEDIIYGSQLTLF
jgi:DNA polymerase-2